MIEKIGFAIEVVIALAVLVGGITGIVFVPGLGLKILIGVLGGIAFLFVSWLALIIWCEYIR